MTQRTAIVADRIAACAACPWRVANQGRKTSGGWYTKANLRRLWNGIRTGEAPGMTCHPTDPDNEPADDGTQAKPGVETKECYGALLLLAREIAALNAAGRTCPANPIVAYRRARPKGLTREGIAVVFERQILGGSPLGGPKLPAAIDEDVAIQHPDFAAPARAEAS